MKSDWVNLAIDMIRTVYECPVCAYMDESKMVVEHHIRNKHGEKEIEKICTE